MLFKFKIFNIILWNCTRNFNIFKSRNFQNWKNTANLNKRCKSTRIRIYFVCVLKKDENEDGKEKWFQEKEEKI